MEKPQTLAEFLGVTSNQPEAVQPLDCSAELSIKDFCARVLASREYRQSIVHRIILGTLPSAVELRFYDYAEGKPADRHEHTGKDGAPIITEIRRVIVHGTGRDAEDEPSASIH